MKNDKLIQTQEDFLKKLPNRVEKIEELLEKETLKSQRELKALFDDLVSLSGSMGFSFIYEAAMRIREIISDNFFDKQMILPILSLIKDYYKHLPHEHKDLLDSLKALDLDHKLQVLVVESNEITAFHLKKILSSSELSVTVCSSGEEAFHKVIGKFFDLVITGINVGPLDGISLIGAIKALRTHEKTTKTILIGPEEFHALPLSCVPDSIIFTDENFSNSVVENIELLFKNKLSSSRNYSIVFLDDDSDTLNLIESSFVKLTNFNISLCSKTKELFATLDKKLPDLIVLDLMLSDESGLDVYTQIRKKYGFGIKIVFMSSREEDFRGQEISKTDALGWIGKPFSTKALPLEIHKFLEID